MEDILHDFLVGLPLAKAQPSYICKGGQLQKTTDAEANNATNHRRSFKIAYQAGLAQNTQCKISTLCRQVLRPDSHGPEDHGRVEGNHGAYTVSIENKGKYLDSACSCYIGRDGDCHHCHALALTFLKDADSFTVTKTRRRKDVRTVADISSYLKGVTLDSLLKQLKEQGITQKALAEGMGMNSRHLSAIKSSELRNRYFNELGATKLACLWVLEHCKKA